MSSSKHFRNLIILYSLNSIDYRLLHAMSMDHYYHPAGHPKTTEAIKRIWDSLTGNAAGTPAVVQVAQGRTLMIEKQARRVCEVNFSDLCETAKGSTDYMALA
jgi:predicted ATPase